MDSERKSSESEIKTIPPIFSQEDPFEPFADSDSITLRNQYLKDLCGKDYTAGLLFLVEEEGILPMELLAGISVGELLITTQYLDRDGNILFSHHTIAFKTEIDGDSKKTIQIQDPLHENLDYYDERYGKKFVASIKRAGYSISYLGEDAKKCIIQQYHRPDREGVGGDKSEKTQNPYCAFWATHNIKCFIIGETPFNPDQYFPKTIFTNDRIDLSKLQYLEFAATSGFVLMDETLLPPEEKFDELGRKDFLRYCSTAFATREIKKSKREAEIIRTKPSDAVSSVNHGTTSTLVTASNTK